MKAAAAAEQEARREARQKEIAVLPSDEAREQALAEELMMRRASNQTGYYGVALDAKPGRSKPYQAKVWYRGKHVNLGRFATAEEASLCIARSPEGQAAAAAAVTPPPMTSDEVREQALAEGLMMRRASNQTGYYGVALDAKPGRSKPYQAKVWYRGKHVNLGRFATAEEASLCIARSPEGQAAAAAAVTPPPPRT